MGDGLGEGVAGLAWLGGNTEAIPALRDGGGGGVILWHYLQTDRVIRRLLVSVRFYLAMTPKLG